MTRLLAIAIAVSCAGPSVTVVEDRCRLWNPPPVLRGDSQADVLAYAAKARAWATVAWESCGDDEEAETRANIAAARRKQAARHGQSDTVTMRVTATLVRKE